VWVDLASLKHKPTLVAVTTLSGVDSEVWTSYQIHPLPETPTLVLPRLPKERKKGKGKDKKIKWHQSRGTTESQQLKS